jgi:hypothetical protein
MRAVASIQAARAARNAHRGLTGPAHCGSAKALPSDIFACKKISCALPTRARDPHCRPRGQNRKQARGVWQRLQWAILPTLPATTV